MVKGKGKVDVDGPSRERTIFWEDDHSKYMLDWYIEYKKNQHAGFVFKKQHHLKCADALNKKFAMGVTLAQVDRHFRDYKEKWKIVERALNNSGNGFDSARCKIIVSESEKEKLNDRARRLLAKPIKFFHEMEELFQGSNADGSLAMDQEACLEVKNSDSEDSGRSGGVNDISCYAKPVEAPDDDSDTLPSPYSSSSTLQSGMKRPRGVKSPAKKRAKSKSRHSEVSEVLTTTMQALQKSIATPPPAPPVPKLDNPYANLWKRLEELSMLRTDDKVNIGVYLARPECEGLRGFLDAASDKTLETWVYKFLCGPDDQ